MQAGRKEGLELGSVIGSSSIICALNNTTCLNWQINQNVINSFLRILYHELALETLSDTRQETAICGGRH